MCIRELSHGTKESLVSLVKEVISNKDGFNDCNVIVCVDPPSGEILDELVRQLTREYPSKLKIAIGHERNGAVKVNRYFSDGMCTFFTSNRDEWSWLRK